MPRVDERLLLWPIASFSMFAAPALGGAALACSSVLLGTASMACLLALFWSGLWIARGSALRRYGVKERNPQFFSTAALQLSRNMNERLLWESRQHPLRLWRWGMGFGVFSGVAVAVTAAVGANGGLLLWIAGTAVFCVRVAAWRRTFVYLTNQRIIGISGLVKRRCISLSLGPCITSQFAVDPIAHRLAQLRLIAAPYGVLELRSRHKPEQGVLRIAYVTQVTVFARLLRGL